MKINNNILYKIFFYLLIILFFIFIFTNKLVEPYNNINICSIKGKDDADVKLNNKLNQSTKYSSNNTNTNKNENDKNDYLNKINKCPDKNNPCEVPKEEDTPLLDQKIQADIKIYDNRLYNLKSYYNNKGVKLVNYINIENTNDLILFQQNYPKAYKSYIKNLCMNKTSECDKKNMKSFVYIPV